VLLGGLIVLGGYSYSASQTKQEPVPIVPSPPVTPVIHPQSMGFIKQNTQSWDLLRYPNGEVRDVPHPESITETGDAEHISLDIHNMNVVDAVRIVGKFTHLNLIISPEIEGKVSLQLKNAKTMEAFDLLLMSQGLAKWPVGNLWFIASHREMLRRKHDEVKLQEVLSESTPLTTQTWQIHYAKAEDIAHLLQLNHDTLISKRGHVRFDPRTNMLYVEDLAENIAHIAVLIHKMDVPIQQVVIEARLASMDTDCERELGINYAVKEPHPGRGHVVTDGIPHYSLAVATLADGSLLDVTLSALEKEGRGELISSPSLFTMNQQTASIESGEEIPYQESSLSGGTAVVFKKAVLSLKVTPQILPGHRVLLQLQVNQDRPSHRIVLGVPAITTRQITTQVLVNNGQTVVLGGIYEINKENGERRIPFLGKIPLVGLLFQQHNAKENKRELLIFVTPKIMSPTESNDYDE